MERLIQHFEIYGTISIIEPYFHEVSRLWISACFRCAETEINLYIRSKRHTET